MIKTIMIKQFQSRAAEYQRQTRMVSSEIRDLKALYRAQDFMTEHTGHPNADLADAIHVLETCVVENLELMERRVL